MIHLTHQIQEVIGNPLKQYKLTKLESSEPVIHIMYCDTIWRKFLGLMFSKELQGDAGIILVENSESKLNTSIHMFFMNYDITVLWLDKDLVIVDKALAKKWHPYYAPETPAQYVVELHVARYSEYLVGETLALSPDDDH